MERGWSWGSGAMVMESTGGNRRVEGLGVLGGVEEGERSGRWGWDVVPAAGESDVSSPDGTVVRVG